VKVRKRGGIGKGGVGKIEVGRKIIIVKLGYTGVWGKC